MRLKDLRQLERDDLHRRAAVERAEAKALRALEKTQRKAARRAAWEARWPRWTAWWELRAKEAKIAATVVGSAVAITAGLPRAISPVVAAGRAVSRWAHRAWTFYADRGVSPPTQPAPSGGASTAVDRLPPRPAPKESPRPDTPTKDQR